MQIENNLDSNINLEENEKKNFLESALGKTINNGIDIGLRYVLPDLVEDEIIDLKDNLINYGLKDGIKKSIDSTITTGKQAVQVLTGNYENITELQAAIKSDGLIDKISDTLDDVIEKVEDDGKINSFTSKAIKKGKNSIMSSIERKIESTLMDQINGAKSIEKYINSWKEYYNNKDFDGMDKEYKKIEKELKDLIPLENTFQNVQYVENIHNLIKNNGQNFELTEEEKELAKKLCV